MTLMVDLDLDLLEVLRQQGSVRNPESRRKVLYEVVWKQGEHGKGCYHSDILME